MRLRDSADSAYLSDFGTNFSTPRLHIAHGQEGALSGTGFVEHFDDGDGGYTFEDRFTPRFLSPMPDMIDLPRGCPGPVLAELRLAFKVFWFDASASANHIRSSLERLMDHLRVGPGILHARLVEFRKSNSDIGDQLLAIKWLGNSASHGTQLDRRELLDALEIVEHALVEILTKRSERIRKLAEGITKRHKGKP